MGHRLKHPSAEYQELLIGLVRLRVLHHAAIKPVFGLGIIEELSRHAYRLGPGTIYPLLRSLARKMKSACCVSLPENGGFAGRR